MSCFLRHMHDFSQRHTFCLFLVKRVRVHEIQCHKIVLSRVGIRSGQLHTGLCITLSFCQRKIRHLQATQTCWGLKGHLPELKRSQKQSCLYPGIHSCVSLPFQFSFGSRVEWLSEAYPLAFAKPDQLECPMAEEWYYRLLAMHIPP